MNSGHMANSDDTEFAWACPSCNTSCMSDITIITEQKFETKGTKHDSGKLMWRLLPIKQLHDVIKVFMHGLSKYKEDDWQLVENANDRYYDAAQRHLTDWRLGKKKDKDSKLPTLAHAVASILILMWHDRRR